LFLAFIIPALLSGDTTANTYIASHQLENTVEVYMGKDAYNFRLHAFNPHRQSNPVLQSKNTLYAGAYFQYKWFAVDYSTSISTSLDDAEHDIKASNYGFSFIRDQWGVSAGFHKFDGFYFSERKKQKSKLPQLKYMEATVDAYLNTRPEKFSMQAAYNYNKQQLKSAGGVNTMLHLAYQQWNILPVVKQHSLHINQQPTDKVTTMIHIVPEIAYGYNLVLHKKGVLLSALGHAGAGYSIISKQGNNEGVTGWRAGWHLQLGYNGAKWYTFISNDNTFQNYFPANSRFLYNQQSSNILTVGRRF
jgi:hypothetical protein